MSSLWSAMHICCLGFPCPFYVNCTCHLILCQRLIGPKGAASRCLFLTWYSEIPSVSLTYFAEHASAPANDPRVSQRGTVFRQDGQREIASACIGPGMSIRDEPQSEAISKRRSLTNTSSHFPAPPSGLHDSWFNDPF